ncbi:MAG: ATP-binding cassette domain-containing protein, partial [Conexivisphaerales archaeon]
QEADMSRATVEFRDFSFTYAGMKIPAVRGINFSVEEGSIALLAGASGSGKSTILRSINGLIPHIYPGEYKGDVFVDGQSVIETETFELARKIGFLFQNPENQIFMFTVERDVAFGLENLGYEPKEIKKKVEWALKLLGISDLAKRSPSELSDGQKQRVALAGSLVMDPKIIVLDEPTSLLDPKTAQEVVHLVEDLNRTLGLTVILVEHRLELVSAIADKIIILNKGEVFAEGKPDQILAKDNLHEAGLSIPPIIELQKRLGLVDSDAVAMDVDDFLQRFVQKWQL